MSALTAVSSARNVEDIAAILGFTAVAAPTADFVAPRAASSSLILAFFSATFFAVATFLAFLRAFLRCTLATS